MSGRAGTTGIGNLRRGETDCNKMTNHQPRDQSDFVHHLAVEPWRAMVMRITEAQVFEDGLQG